MGVAKAEKRLEHFYVTHHLSILLSFFLNIYLFIYLWLRWVFVAACGLSLVATSEGYSFVAVHRLLIAVASLVVEHGL